jgi:hypothetical protein
MKLTSYHVPLFSYFPGIENHSYETLRPLAVIQEISDRGILFTSSLIGSKATTFTCKDLGLTLQNKEEIIGEFSDGTRVIYFHGPTAYEHSYVQIAKDSKIRFQIRYRDHFEGILLFLDTYLVIMDKDISFGRQHCRLRIFTRAGDLIYKSYLGSKYSATRARIFEEVYSIILYAKDLSEATVWNFGDTSQVFSVAKRKRKNL